MALEEDFDFTPTPFIEMEGLEETKTGLEVGVEEEAGLKFTLDVTLVPPPSTMNVLVALLPSPTIVAALPTPPSLPEVRCGFDTGTAEEAGLNFTLGVTLVLLGLKGAAFTSPDILTFKFKSLIFFFFDFEDFRTA